MKNYIATDSYDLSFNDLLVVHVGSLLGFVSLAGLGWSYFRKEKKRLAWVISTTTSATLVLCGIYYLAAKGSLFTSLTDGYLSKERCNTVFNEVNNFSIIINIWFSYSLLLDLIVGYVFYREYVGILTGYIHHVVFIWMMYVSATGQPIPLTTNSALPPLIKSSWNQISSGSLFSSTFSMMIIEDFPTFLLGLGSIFSQYRTDKGFGWTFFLLRICYHCSMIYYASRCHVDPIVMMLLFFTLSLHLFWFWGWIKKYSNLATLFKNSNYNHNEKKKLS